MKTIAIDIRLIGRKRTGDEAVFRNLVRETLLADRNDRYLLLTDRSDEATRSAIFMALGMGDRLPDNAEIVFLPTANRYTWNLFSVPRFLFRRKVDIFHTQYILPAFVPRRTRVVAHVHDISFRVFPKYVSPVDRMFLSIFIPDTMRRADLIVVPSRFTKDEIVSWYGVPKERIAVVPNAVDAVFLSSPTREDLARARSRNGLPESFVLSVGTMQPRKDIPTLLRAFSGLRNDFPELRLVLVGGRGGKNYDRTIETVLSEEGLEDAVIFSGYVPEEDMPALYASARAFAFPSRYEGFGIPLLEAFAAGTPVVATDIPSFREVGGDAISFFPSGDVAVLRESLYTLLIDEHLREERLRAERERLAGYSWAESAREMLAGYLSLHPSEQ
jgi:glycosyltransferase involved in cell wall biosynthesis